MHDVIDNIAKSFSLSEGANGYKVIPRRGIVPTLLANGFDTIFVAKKGHADWE
jgi:hypothetical protein